MDRKAYYVLILTAPLILSMATFFIQIHLANGVCDERSESDCSEFVAFVKGLFEDVTTATDYRYDAKDNQGRGLDVIKIIENPEGGYLGAYHFLVGGNFQVRLANSTDLLHWTHIRTVEQHASQPTIAQAPNGAYIVAFEKEDASSHLQFQYYSNLSTLINGPPDATFDAPRTLSSLHEGTPNVYNVTIKGSTLNACIGFHYDTGSVDNAAVGWLTIPLDNPQNMVWSNTAPLTRYNQNLRDNYQVRGNIGDRDYGQVFGRNFTLQEGNLKPRPTDYAAWRIFLYDHLTSNFTMLNIKTHKGSTSFGNPTFTWLKSPSGKNAIVITYFLFSEGAEIGEAGQLIFYKEFTVVPDDYPTIQEAINRASTGDTIYVRNGEYQENIMINKTVSLVGESRTGTILDGDLGTVIHVTADGVSIACFTIQNGGYYFGIYLQHCKNCVVKENNVSNNWLALCAIYVDESLNCSVTKNTVSHNFNGIGLRFGGNHKVIENNVYNNHFLGISIVSSRNNTLAENCMLNNGYNFMISGHEILDFLNDINTSNTINGKPIYYLWNESRRRIDSSLLPNIGYLALVNSTNITIKNLNISQNGQGIMLAYTNNSIIKNVNASNNGQGIELIGCRNCSVINNIVDNTCSLAGWTSIKLYQCDNSMIGWNEVINDEAHGANALELSYCNNCTIVGNVFYNRYVELAGSLDCKFFHNNFINSHAFIYGVHPIGNHTWDNGYPSGGNYWSDYNGADSDHDGIADVPYTIGANNTDNYPLMGVFWSFNTSLGYHVNIVSNSTIEDFEYFESNSTIKMYASNMTANQTFGFCRVCVPHTLMNETYQVTINGAEPYYVNYTLYDNGTHRWIYFSYQHSTLEIIIVPEFPSILILPLFMIATLLAVIVYKRKRSMRH